MAKRNTTTKRNVAGERPRLKLLVACDHVSRDPNSEKVTLYGVYDKLLPSDLNSGVSMRLFASLAGGSGNHIVSFALLDAKGTIYRAENDPSVAIKCKKNADNGIIAGLVRVPIKRRGRYELVAFCDGRKYSYTYPLTVVKQGK